MKILITSIIICIFSLVLNAQCPVSNTYTANSQIMVDSFSIKYGDCHKLGGLTLRGENINDVSAFSNLDTIVGLDIVNTTITSLGDIDVHLIGSLYLQDNDLIQNVSLKHSNIIGTIVIVDNKSLNYVNFENLEQINSLQVLQDSMHLTIKGGGEIGPVSIRGKVNIESENRSELNQYLFLTNNSIFNSFEKLNSVFSFQKLREFRIGDTEKFNSIGLESGLNLLNSNFYSINELNTEGFNNIDFTSAEMTFDSITNLENLNDFSSSTFKSVDITNNPNLLSLDGLEPSIANIRDVTISNNPSLTDVSALENIPPGDGIKKLVITDNASLQECAYEGICDRVRDFGSTAVVRVENNLETCMDVSAILDACITSTTDAGQSSSDFYPNPTGDLIHFNYDIQSVKIYSALGSLVKSKVGKYRDLDVTNLQSGVYYIQFTSSNVVYKSKLLKL